jgi:tight adherence protein C
MSGWLIGALLGVIASAGVLIAVRAAPPLRAVRLADRLAPYVADAPAPSRLLAPPGATSTPFTVIRRLFGPIVGELVAHVDRVIGGSVSVRRRLAGLGSGLSVEEFRLEQIVWGGCGLVGGAGLVALVSALHGGVQPVLVGVAAVGMFVAGLLGRDWWLSHQLQRHEQAMLAEFPVIADLLALAVVAGEAPVDALRRVCGLSRGALAGELGGALARANAGTPLTAALNELAERTTLEPLARFLEGLTVAIERGTPLAAVLRAQAIDVREIGKRTLLESGGRREVAMMVPVVFMILPVTVLFALYPGLLTLTSLAR